MSAKISGQIWDLDLPRCERDVLHAMADHADHEGYNVFPSVPLIAWKTNYSERQVRRAMADLRDRHILVPLREDSGKVVEYGIDLSKAPRKITYREWKKAQKTPDKMSPLTKCPSGQNVTPPGHGVRGPLT